MSLWKIALCGVMLSALSIGCSSGREDQWTKDRKTTVPVTGKVVSNNQPLAGATVLFYAEGQELTARGLTNEEGEFELTTYEEGDGAVPGPHKITVKKTEVKTVPNPNDPQAPPISSEEVWHTPKNYAQRATTPLSEIVKEDGENNFTLTLQGQ